MTILLKSVFFIVCVIMAMAFGADVDTAGAAASADTSSVVASADTVGVSAVVDTDSVADISVDVSIDTSAVQPAPVLLPPRPPVNYTGAALSAVIPGAGQVYNRRYVMGGAFLAAEAIAGSMTIYRYGTADLRWKEYEWQKEYEDYYKQLADGKVPGFALDPRIDKDSLLSLNSVLTDRAKFEARRAQYDALNFLTWAVGIHLYGFMDALELGGLKHHGELKNPTVAGLLAAVPFLGLGQLYNGKPSKAGMIVMAQSGLAVVAGNHHRMMNRASLKYEEMRDTSAFAHEIRAEHLGYWSSRQSQNFSRRNTYLWMYLVTYIYTILDAVVDAHLSDYDERMRIGPDLAVGMDGSGRVGASLTIDLMGRRGGQ